MATATKNREAKRKPKVSSGTVGSKPSSSPYSHAASLLNEMWKRQVSLKSLVYKDGSMTCSKTTYAQASNVLSHRSRLQATQEKFDIDANSKGLLYVLLYELLAGPNRAIKGGGSLKRTLVDKEQDLRQAWEELSNEDETEVDASLPRYVRVNTLQATTKQVVNRLSKFNIPFQVDPHVPDLFVFASKEAETTTKLLDLSTVVVLQDKSSCFSALCLVHGYEKALLNADYLDACAAPGNKTLHLAALLAASAAKAEDSSSRNLTIYAFDKDPRRCKDLSRRIDQHVGDKVRMNVSCQDFLATKPTEYATVGAILLDPTCSGSGCTRTGRDIDEKRLRSLSGFQLSALLHAMSFPNISRIVYSTCSIHTIENEQVVARALQKHSEWKLISPRCLSQWKRRGQLVDGLTAQEAAALIRVDPAEDETGGFFVACFERTKRDDEPHGAAISSSSSSSLLLSKKRSVNEDRVDGAAVRSKRPKDSASEAHDNRPNKIEQVKTTASSSERALSRLAASSSEKSQMATGEEKKVSSQKRSKKNAWKQRQREEKQRRLLLLQKPKS